MKSIVIGCMFLVSALCLDPFIGKSSFAAMSVTIPTTSSSGKFTIQGNNLVNVAGVEIKLAYDPLIIDNPVVLRDSLGGLSNSILKGFFSEENIVEPGLFTFTSVTATAISGSGSLLTVAFDLTGQQLGKIRSMQTSIMDSNLNYIYSDAVIYDEAITIKDKITNSTSLTNSKDVSLVITDSLTNVVEMRISEDIDALNNNSVPWEPYATTRNFTLSDGSGVKTVYVQFKNDSNNIFSTTFQNSILYDNIPPSGTININGGSQYTAIREVTATLAFSDDSGMDKMQFSLDNKATWTDLEPYASTKTLNLPSGDGSKTVWVKVTDKLGNSSEQSATITMDSPPTGTVTINSGDTFTRNTAVTLNISATDEIGTVSQYCVSNSSSCPSASWKNYPPSDNNWLLSAGNGIKTVYAWFKDNRGSISAIASDTITLDATPPANGTLKVTQLSEALKLDWTGITDVTSGVGQFKLYHSLTSIPPACSGELIYSGSDTSYTHTGPAENSVHYYRLCATDNAGNTNTGATASGKIVTRPLATITINEGDYTKISDVTLAITGSDSSNVVAYGVSNSASCSTAWTPIPAAPSFTDNAKAWKLTAGNGVKKVTVCFKDSFGNISMPATATITQDATPPTNGVLKITQLASKALKLDWSGVTDSPSGVKEFNLYHSDTAIPASCSGTPIYTGTGATYTHDTAAAENSMHYYRLCAIDNAGNTNTGATISGKAVTPPVGSLTLDIKVGEVYQTDAAYTNKTSVYLTINATDSDGVAGYCVSNSSTCTAWVTASAYPVTQKPWTLSSGNGIKTVYVRFKDTMGNVSVPVTDTITLDATVPVSGTLVVTPLASNALKLDWSGFSDALSGIKEYNLYHSTTAIPLCSGTPLETFANNVSTKTYTGLTQGSMHYYRLCATDNAGNINASGATAGGMAIPEVDPPINGNVIINKDATYPSGAPYTNSATVKLTLSASDINKVSAYCISNSATCLSSGWKAITPSVTDYYSPTPISWILASGVNSIRAVNVWFRDSYGNITPSPASATITLDNTKPVNGKLTATQQPGALQLDWTGFSDAVSGIKEYNLYHSLTAIPTSCSGELLYTGSGSTYTHSSLTAGTLHYYRICATDNALNTTTGVTARAKAIPELGAPTGSVQINGTATYAKAAVTLTINASDTSGVAAYCVSNTPTCGSTSWKTQTTYPVNRSWTLLTGSSGDTRTVYVWFKDIFGIVTPAPVSDSVILDLTAPVNGTLTVTPQSLKNVVSWSDFSDATSGIAGYRLMRGTVAPTSCGGIPIATPAADQVSYEDTGLKAGTLYYYRLCAVDNVGNISSGVGKSGKPLP